jgi:hypothetical protein
MRYGEAREVHVVEPGVAIRQSGGIQVCPACVETDQIVLEVGTT